MEIMKKTLKYAAPVLMLPLLFASCLKDDDRIGPEAPGAVTANIIEFADLVEPSSPRTSTVPKYSLAFDIAPSATLNLKIKCVGAEKAKEDIKVTIALDNGLIATYNAERTAEEDDELMTVLPADRYAVTVTEAVIKKGEREAIIPIELMPDKFTFDADYAIGLAITSASSGNVSGNFGKMLLQLSAKNPYDGLYAYKNSVNSDLAPGREVDASLVTVGANTVQLIPGLVALYSNVVTYTVDPTTNKVEVNMTTLLPIATDPSSHYDPVTKTFHLKWKSVGRGWTFEETLVYTGPRD